MPDNKNRLVVLGHISAAHGIRGEVVIRSYTADPLNIAAYGPLTAEGGTRTFEIVDVRSATKGVIARLAGVNDRSAAEALVGIGLAVERARLPDPDPEEFYVTDLIGLDAVDPAGNHIGSVVAIQNFGAGDIIELKVPEQRDTELVPFTAASVPEIDLGAGRVVVVLPATDDDSDDD